MSDSYESAMRARSMYRMGAIGRDKALDMMSDYIREFNEKAVTIAKKYGVRPKKFSFAAFCR